MALVITGEVVAGQQVQVLCSGCLEEVGILTFEEVGILSAQKENTVFCFDCDGIRSDEIPGQLTAKKDEYVVIYNPESRYLAVIDDEGKSHAVEL